MSKLKTYALAAALIIVILVPVIILVSKFNSIGNQLYAVFCAIWFFACGAVIVAGAIGLKEIEKKDKQQGE